MLSCTAGQDPAGSSVVMVKVMLPAVLSALPGVYVAPGSAALSKVPSPPEVQVMLEALPPKDPESV